MVDENWRQLSARKLSQKTQVKSLEKYRLRAQTLEQAYDKAQQRASSDQQEIQQLLEAITALTQENIYLCGKIADFQNSGTLSTGLHRTYELLKDQVTFQHTGLRPTAAQDFLPTADFAGKPSAGSEGNREADCLGTLYSDVQKTGPSESVESSAPSSQCVSVRSARQPKPLLRKYVPSYMRTLRLPNSK